MKQKGGDNSETKLVYSTGFGDLRKVQPATPKPVAAPSKGSPKPVKVLLETGGRRGKTVTAIRNLQLSAPEQEALLKTLKSTCGAGGAIEEDQLIIQGDHREKVTNILRQKNLIR